MVMRMKEKKKRGLRILKTEDPKSLFQSRNLTPEEILARLGRPTYLLSHSAKIDKSRKRGIYSKILYLTSGIHCSHSTNGCRSNCLGFGSGRMGSDQATAARDRRSALLLADRPAFLHMLVEELHRLCYEADTYGMIPAVRLNGSSDLSWHGEFASGGALNQFADRLIAYDYTKVAPRFRQFLRGTYGAAGEEIPWPGCYSLTFSLSEQNAHQAEEMLSQGGNVAVVFWPDLPASGRWLGYPVIDGDYDDVRFFDPSPCVVGLRAKGIARKDLTGFVVRTDQPMAERHWSRNDAA